MRTLKAVALAATFLAAIYAAPSSAAPDHCYLRLGIGDNSSAFGGSANKWNDEGEAGVNFGFGCRWFWSRSIVAGVGLEHHSQIGVGLPFHKNDGTAESTLDHVGAYVEWRFSP